MLYSNTTSNHIMIAALDISTLVTPKYIGIAAVIAIIFIFRDEIRGRLSKLKPVGSATPAEGASGSTTDNIGIADGNTYVSWIQLKKWHEEAESVEIREAVKTMINAILDRGDRDDAPRISNNTGGIVDE